MINSIITISIKIASKKCPAIAVRVRSIYARDPKVRLKATAIILNCVGYNLYNFRVSRVKDNIHRLIRNKVALTSAKKARPVTANSAHDFVLSTKVATVFNACKVYS